MRLPKRKRKRKLSRKWGGKAPRKRGWGKVRAEMAREARNGERVLDHIVAERWVLTWAPKANPHARENLMWLTPERHGVKLAADGRLCKGDLLGYLEILRTNGWPMERVNSALQFFGIIK